MEISTPPPTPCLPPEVKRRIPARALYVHVPFCQRRCGYCDFPLVTGRDHRMAEFLDAIGREAAEYQLHNSLSSIFLGGGTPTHLPHEFLRRLFERISQSASRNPDGEVSVEANPNDIDSAIVDCLQRCGVTRVSLGAQSLHADKLARLERTHDVRQIREASKRLLDAGFSLNLDMIFGVAGDQPATWLDELQQAVELGAQHLSTYQLTIEKGTAFWNRRLHGETIEAGDSLAAELYELTIDRLGEWGLEQYEVSNFARPGHACRHNLGYWSGQPYLGWGPGAASFAEGIRWRNHRGVASYLRRVQAGESPIDFVEKLAPEAAAREHIVFSLRRVAGIDRAQFAATTGYSLDQLIGPQLQLWLDHAWVVDNGLSIRLTRRGMMLSDSLWPTVL